MDPIIHFEIPVRNLESAKKFYGPIFGWKMDEWKMPDGSTLLGAHTTPVDEKTRLPLKPGAINGMIVEMKGVNKSPSFSIQVDSIEEKVKQVEKAGGKQLAQKVSIPGMGYYAYIADPDGNTVGLWEDAPKK